MSRPLTVVAVAYEGAPYIGNLVRIARQSRAVEAVIVVDNASRDESAQVAEQSGAKVIRLPGNIGYGAACNEGLSRCNTQWIAFCNQDLEPSPDMFDSLIGVAEDLSRKFGTSVIAAPRLQAQSGESAETAHRLPSWRDQAIELLFGAGAARARDVIPTAQQGVYLCDWVSAACIVAPTTPLRAIGGFDPLYFMYVEDVDLFNRWKGHGGLVAWVASATALHIGGRRPLDPRLHAMALSNWVTYYTRTAGPVAAAVVAISGISGSLARALYWALLRGGDRDARAYRRMFLMGALGSLADLIRRRTRASALDGGRKADETTAHPPLA